MSARHLMHHLQQPLLHTVWQGAAATAPVWATATSQLTGLTAAASTAFQTAPLSSWRAVPTDAPSTSLPPDAMPWSSGVASSSQTQVRPVLA